MSLLEEINNNINVDGLNQVEIARLLYIELGKRVSFSTKFQNTDARNFALMMRANVDIRTFKQKEVNCVMWSQLYSQLLSYYGIENEIIDQGHNYVEFIANNKRMVADATYGGYTDLSRIHNGDDTTFFGLAINQKKAGVSNVPMLNLEFYEKLKNIDKKIGYNDEKYKDLNELKELISKIKNGEFDINNYVNGEGSNALKKLEFLFAKTGVLDSGFYEAKDFLHSLEYMTLTQDEMANVKGKELYRTKKDGNVDIIEVISLKEENDYKYFVLCPNMPVKEISKEDIIKFAIVGFGKSIDVDIPGIDFPKDFEPGKKMHGINYVLNRISNYKIYKNPNILEVERALK